MMDLPTLTDHFAIPGVLTFAQNEQGLIRACVTTDQCTAEIYLQGAHLTHWQPAGHKPVLFLSERSAFAPGKAIRGGVPIIFPWFGARTATPDSPRTGGPSHGFARTSLWEVAFAAVAGDDLHLTFTLGPSEISRGFGFDHFRLAYQIVLGRELRMQLTIANQGATPLHVEEALHTYLAVGDAREVSIRGLFDTDFIDKTENFQHKHQTEHVLKLTGETDRPYLNTEQTVTLDDPSLHRRIAVSKSNSKTTVIWNPWSALSATLTDMTPDGWQRMTCIETANAATNALTLQPGTHHTMECRIVVQELSV
jgi:glucose-6-phosphate 1-epimerase